MHPIPFSQDTWQCLISFWRNLHNNIWYLQKARHQSKKNYAEAKCFILESCLYRL